MGIPGLSDFKEQLVPFLLMSLGSSTKNKVLSAKRKEV